MEDVAALDRAGRTAREAELCARISKALAVSPRAAWGAKFDAAGIPWGPVNTIQEVADDPHFIARDLFRELADSIGRKYRHVAQPLKFDGEHPGPARGAPGLGEHTEEVLSTLLRKPRR
jgi:crotonobetainyl-CoA:carnitine CoA-transferase CaiB-like acyl-CoA transferase